jgi:hypothetical protein
MVDVVVVALITGGIALLNGPVLLAILNKRMRRTDEITELRSDVARLFKLTDRIAEGLTYGLENDAVIFRAFRKNAINGESEIQEEKMREYFSRCTADGFRSGKEA